MSNEEKPNNLRDVLFELIDFIVANPQHAPLMEAWETELARYLGVELK